MYLPLPPSLSRPRRRRALPSSIHSESTIDLKTSAAPVAFCAGMQSLCMSPRTSARTARTIHEAAATPRERLGWLAGQERPRNQTFSKQVTCETFLLSREGETRVAGGGKVGRKRGEREEEEGEGRGGGGWMGKLTKEAGQRKST